METAHQLQMYEVLSIRQPSAAKAPRTSGHAASARKTDLVLSYFDWLCSGEVGPREKAWAKYARPRLA
jgi:hypothetical protein